MSRQAFYGWRCCQRRSDSTEREHAEAELITQIRAVHADSGGAYGSPKVTAALRTQGMRVNHKRIEQLMRAHAIAGIRMRRPKRTTIQGRSTANLPDLLRRNFAPGAPDRAWCSPVTYITTKEGWLCLAV